MIPRMDPANPLGFGAPRLSRTTGPNTEHLLTHRPLHRVLAFTGRSIHDVVNNPIVKREVIGYYKLYRNIERSAEIGDLERQWNPLGRRTM
jgi:hypothetical protein